MSKRHLQLIIHESPYSVTETVESLEKASSAKNMILFAFIDHSAEAQKIKMVLRDEKVLIFGDPKVGTFLMQENPTIGIELPLRILVWQDEKRVTQVAYIDPISLGESYNIVKNAEILKKMSVGMAHLVTEVIA